MAKPFPVQLNFEVPPFEERDARPEALLRVLEHSFPGVRMDLEIAPGGREEPVSAARLIRIPDREAWLSERRRQRRGGLITSGTENPVLTVSFECDEKVLFAHGGAAPVIIWMPSDEPSKPGWAARVAECGDALNAWSMTAMPAGVRVPVFQHPRWPLAARKGGLDYSGLPRLTPGRISRVELPIQLGWMNYWSAPTAALLGFPDRSRDAEWLSHAVATPTGAWVVQLTSGVFDDQRQDHIDALARAYQRFEGIGVRW